MLSRLVAPSDLGLVAIVLVMVGAGELLRDFGIGAAATQVSNLSAGQKTNLFWINVGSAAALTGLLALLAPIIAVLFDDHRLQLLSIVMSATFLLNGFQAQFQVDLVRQLRFRALAASDIGAQVLGVGAAITLAALHAGYWALAAQYLVAYASLCVMRVVLAHWWPSWPQRHSSIRPIITFGLHLSVAQLLNYGATNADNAILGLTASPRTVGLYARAFQLLTIPVNQLLSPLTNVALPLLSRAYVDRGEWLRFIVRAQLMVGFATSVGLGLVAGIAPSLFEAAFGPKWHESALYFQILALGGAFQCLSFISFWMFLSSGKSASLLTYNLATKTIAIVLVLIGSIFGPAGVAAGYAISLILSWPVSIAWLSRLLQLNLWPLVRSGARYLVLGIVVYVAAALSSSAAGGVVRPWISMGVGVTSGLVIAAGLFGLSMLSATGRDDARVLLLAVQLKRGS